MSVWADVCLPLLGAVDTLWPQRKSGGLSFRNHPSGEACVSGHSQGLDGSPARAIQLGAALVRWGGPGEPSRAEGAGWNSLHAGPLALPGKPRTA